MVTLTFESGTGSSKRVASIALPDDSNFAARFTRDEDNSTDRRLWTRRIAFGSLDAPDMLDRVESFAYDVRPNWYIDGFDVLTIAYDFRTIVSRWYGCAIDVTERTFDGRKMYFFEVYTSEINVHDAKDTAKDYTL